MSAVIGIDLGTTNTVAACVRDGRVHVLADEKGNRLLPSVVSFHPNGEVLVGGTAKTRRLSDARNTIASIKRLIGRPWDSDEIRLARSRFAFELREGPGQGALVVARGEAYTLPEISAFVLKRTRQIAEAALGEKVDKAVITVPAHFNELQRASTKVAGRVAGLEVLRILNEPTAAALAYGFGSSANERVAVYDYGGGTFDCSLLELSGNLYEVLATAGDTFLGGDDIDNAIAEQMCSAFLLQHRYDPRADPQAFEKLRAAAETLKIELSTNMQAQMDFKDVAYGVGGKQLGLTFTMTQADLDALAEPFIERTLQVTQDALNTAHLEQGSFDRIVLVGGTTRMPVVRRRVEAFFGMAPLDRVNPDEVVAIGAAIQAAALSEAGMRSLPPPPMPGVLRAAQASGPRGMRTGDVSDEAMQAMVTPDRKLPSIAPNKPSVPPGEPLRRGTLRPGPAPPDSAQDTDPHPATATDDSMSFANTLPGAQAPRTGRERALSSNTLQSSLPDRSVTRGGHTLASERYSPERSIAEPPSINQAPPGYPGMSGQRQEAQFPPPPPSRAPPPLPQARPAPKRPPTQNPRAGAPFGDPFGGEVGPLPTDDISRIVPEAQAHTQRGGMSTNTVQEQVGPLDTEDISRISPDVDLPSALRGPRAAKPPPLSRSTGTHTTELHDPGPLPTDDISRISPEPLGVAARRSAERADLPATRSSTGGNIMAGVTRTAVMPLQAPAPLPPAGMSAKTSQPAPPAFQLPQSYAPPPPNFGPPAQQAYAPPQAAYPVEPPYQEPPALPAGDPRGQPGWRPQFAPVLIDVTPRALVVEVVGGYSDTVIARNATIPCEHTRVFATGRDLQTTVHVRVAQGEAQRFSENTVLGELELSGLRPAARGEVTLSVTFELDADGTMQVRATDTSSGKEARATMRLVAVAQDEEQIEEMIERSRSVSVKG